MEFTVTAKISKHTHHNMKRMMSCKNHLGPTQTLITSKTTTLSKAQVNNFINQKRIDYQGVNKSKKKYSNNNSQVNAHRSDST